MKSLDLLKQKIAIAKKNGHKEIKLGLKELDRLIVEIAELENSIIQRERDNIILQSVVNNAQIPRKKRKTIVELEGDKF